MLNVQMLHLVLPVLHVYLFAFFFFFLLGETSLIKDDSQLLSSGLFGLVIIFLSVWGWGDSYLNISLTFSSEFRVPADGSVNMRHPFFLRRKKSRCQGNTSALRKECGLTGEGRAQRLLASTG